MLKKVGAAVVVVGAAVGGSLALNERADEARRMAPKAIKDHGLEMVLVVDPSDLETISEINQVLIDAFCRGVEEGCEDTAEKSLSQRGTIKGKPLIAAQWTLTSEQLPHMLRLQKSKSIILYRSREEFRNDWTPEQ